MPAFCKSVYDHDDHVWRWRNEQAGYFEFARRTWQEALRRNQVCFDIDSLDLIKSADRWDRADANYEQWIDNGRDPIH